MNNEIAFCGLKANVISASATSVTVSVPALVTSVTQQLYSIASDTTISGKPFSDSQSKAILAFDGSPNTVYYSSNAVCYIGVDFGVGSQGNIRTIRYMPNPSWAIVAPKLDGGVFEGSNNNLNWTNIFSIDSTQVHSGWNEWKNSVIDSVQFRYIRFRHNSTSYCSLADL